MRLHFVALVAWKELISTWRDKRTLLTTILMPMVMIPLFIIGLPLLLGKVFTGQQLERQTVGVVHLSKLPQTLKNLLTEDQKQGEKILSVGVKLIEVEDAKKAVQEGTVDVALSISDTVPTVAGKQPLVIPIFAKLSSLKGSTGAFTKVSEALQLYNDQLVAKKLVEEGLDLKILKPIVALPTDASTEQEQRSGQLAFLIPLFILQFILAGGMPTAIDSTAGEKERGTLEVLLVSPIRRLEVVVGKFVSVTIFSLITACFSMLGLGLSGALARPLMATLTAGPGATDKLASTFGGNLTLDLSGFLALLAVACVVAMMVSILQLSISIFARSFKEAQGYLVPLTIFASLSAVALQFSDFLQIGPIFYALPIVGAEVTILDIIKGNWSAMNVMLTVSSHTLCTILLLLLARRTFERENVIFRN
ncbi:MAG: ABC transporter permease [Deinococcaceae bacterium]